MMRFMLNASYFFFMLLLIACNTSNSSTKNAIKVNLDSYHASSIMFYNVENLFDTKNDFLTEDDAFTPGGEKEWTQERYRKKLKDISNVIASLSLKKTPLLVGLSEVENIEVVEDLIQEPVLTNNSNYAIVHEESPDTRGIDVALVYDQNRFRYISHESIRIDFPWDERIKTRDILYVQGALASDELLHVFVNHWSSRRKGKKATEKKRLYIAEQLRKKVEDVLKQDANAKILVMGDFNDHPNDKSIQHVLKARKYQGIKDDELFNLMAYLNNEGKGTYVHNNKWGLLDQLMISKTLLNATEGVKIKHNKGYILKKDWMLYEKRDGSKQPNKTYGGDNYYGGYSDHLPVYLILK